MPTTYLCRKCGKTYSVYDYLQNKFCQECGSFLIEHRSDTGSPFAQQRLFQENARATAEITVGNKKIGDNRQHRENTKKLPEHSADECTRVLAEGASKRIITYSDPYDIRKLVAGDQFSSLERFKLNLKAQELKAVGSIDKLLSIDALRTKIDPYPFQMRVALSVLQDMNSNAILADEVGLGKTVEAGLILKELVVRGLVQTILVVVPKSLIPQWQGEMLTKFGERLLKPGDSDFTSFEINDRVICSYGILVRRFEEIKKKKWDLIIVDEAHTFRNPQSKGRQALALIRRNHLLLLTATPLCNKLTDLYSLVDLLHPGLLGSPNSFVSRYAADSKCRKIRADMVGNLKLILDELMCRTRRAETDIPFSRRHVESRTIVASDLEYKFIDEATQYLREIGNNKFKTVEELREENPTIHKIDDRSKAILIFQAISMQQSISSSPYAAIESLNRRYEKYPSERDAITRLMSIAENITSPSKIELLKKVVKEVDDEQALIFCSRKITAEKIKELLSADYGNAELFTGEMGASARERVLDDFRKGIARYLVATDAAAEGLNLQNCCVMFNFDLHWNPMKIEQRIGRIHRFGQERDVTIFNLSVRDTIDDYVLHILYQKIELFTMTIGKIETVLAEIKEGSQDLDKTIMEIVLRSKNRKDIKKELEKLSNDLSFAKEKQELSEKFTKGVLD